VGILKFIRVERIWIYKVLNSRQSQAFVKNSGNEVVKLKREDWWFKIEFEDWDGIQKGREAEGSRGEVIKIRLEK